MILIDEVPQLKYRNEMNPVYLLHPGAEYFSIGISIIASGPLTSYPITAGLRVRAELCDR